MKRVCLHSDLRYTSNSRQPYIDHISLHLVLWLPENDLLFDHINNVICLLSNMELHATFMSARVI